MSTMAHRWSNEILKESFRKLSATMVDTVNADDISHHLLADGVLTEYELEDIEGLTNRRRKMRFLLVILLQSKNPVTFLALRQALLSPNNSSKYSWFVQEAEMLCTKLQENEIIVRSLERMAPRVPKPPSEPVPALPPVVPTSSGCKQLDPNNTRAVPVIRIELNKLIECEICKDIFDDPRVLPCAHTFCLKCVYGMIHDERFGSGDLTSECPLCHRNFNLSISDAQGLPKNIIALKLIAHSGQKTVPKLSIAHTGAALVKKPVFKSFESMLHDLSPDHCSVHHTEPLKLFCDDCKTLVCIKCIVDKHRRHSFSITDDVAETFKKQINGSIRSLIEGARRCDSLCLDIESKKDRFDAQVKYLQQKTAMLAQQLNDAIRDMENLVNSRLREQENSFLNELGQLEDDIQVHKTLISHHMMSAEELLKKGSAADIVQSSKFIAEQTEQLLNLDRFDAELKTCCVFAEVTQDHADQAAFIEGIQNLFSKVIDSCSYLPAAYGPTSTGHRRSTLSEEVDVKTPVEIECECEVRASSKIPLGIGIDKPLPVENLDDELVQTAPPLHRNVPVFTFRTRSHSATSEVTPKHFIRTRGRTTSVTFLDDELFVTHEKCSSILVFDGENFDHKKSIQLGRLFIYPFGLAACAISRCLYIADQRGKDVYRIDINDSINAITPWWQTTSNPIGLSVTTTGHVIVVCRRVNAIDELDPSGRVVRILTLPESIVEPRHAVLLPNGQFVLSQSGTLHQICLIDGVGQVTVTFGSKKGPFPNHLNEPRGIAVCANGNCLFVADRDNNMVRIMDWNLQQCDRIWWSHGSAFKSLQGPRSVCYDESRNRLYVANWNGKGVTVIDEIPIKVESSA